MPSGAFFRAQFIGSRAARKETDTGLMRTHAPFSSPPRRKAPRSDRPAPFRNAMRRIFPRAIHRPPRRKPPRAAPSAHAVRLGIAVHGSHAAPPTRSHAPFERRLTRNSRTLIRRFGSPRSTFHSTLFDVYRIADLRAHFKASVSRPAKTASCRLKKTRRRARSVPRPRQCVLKGGSSAGSRAPLSPLHLPNVLDNAV